MVRLAVAFATPRPATPLVLHALRILSSRIRVEPGCRDCRIWTDEGDESVVRYVEVWASEDAMRRRVRSKRFTQLLEVLESAVAPPSVRFEFVTETRGLDYVEEVRHLDRLLGSPDDLTGIDAHRFFSIKH
jgi:quinol monooxygenase YgiN